jgi:hypothetical protein
MHEELLPPDRKRPQSLPWVRIPPSPPTPAEIRHFSAFLPQYQQTNQQAIGRLKSGDARFSKNDRVRRPCARGCKLTRLEADDGLAAKAAAAKLFEHLARAAQFNHGADARSDSAVREHVRNLVQPLRR